MGRRVVEVVDEVATELTQEDHDRAEERRHEIMAGNMGTVAPVQVVALGLSIGCVLGDPAQGDPQINFQTHLPLDAGPEVHNQFVDAIMAIIERQRAKAEIGRIEKHIRQCVKMIANNHSGDAEREATYLENVEALRDMVAEAEAKVPGITEKDRLAFEEGGRAGAYKPSNSASSAIAGLKKEVTKHRLQITTLGLERDEARKSLERADASWAKDIDDGDEEIARLSAIVG